MRARGAVAKALTVAVALFLCALPTRADEDERDLRRVIEREGAVRPEDLPNDLLRAPEGPGDDETAEPTPLTVEETRGEAEIAEPAPAADEGPLFFEYTLDQQITNGVGAYEGWSDRTTATGRYELDGEQMWARYRWRYASPDDARSGDEDRRVPFSDAERRYTTAAVDLDDYDERAVPAAGRAIWWRIPVESAPGDRVRILDDEFTVVGRVPASATTHGRETILLERVGAVGSRDDAYGRYSTRITDRYWFDAETGYFLREVFEEHDVGALEGEYAEFDVLETTEVTAASYLPGTLGTWSATPPSPPASTRRSYGSSASSSDRADLEHAIARERTRRRTMLWLAVGSIVSGILAYLAYRWHKSRRKHDFEGKIVRVTKPEELPANVTGSSELFTPLLPHLVRQTLQAGLPVYVASTSEQGAGIALGAPAGEAATIFARDTAACEALRQAIDSAHFFSEVRHEHSFAARAAASQHTVALTGSHAYNVLETHEVLVLRPVPSDTSYDRQLVRRAKAADLPAVTALMDAVYGGSSKAWLEAAHATGDVILVATEGDAVVGCAMVAVVGSAARFHGLSVAKSHRGKGIGKELNRARARIASDLGAEYAVVEIAAWNVASLEIARAVGFTKAGAMYVQTTNETKSDRKFRRA